MATMWFGEKYAEGTTAYSGVNLKLFRGKTDDESAEKAAGEHGQNGDDANSLKPAIPTRLTITCGITDKAAYLFKDLQPHLQELYDKGRLDEIPDLNGPCPYTVYEDEGVGLEGDFTKTDPDDDQMDNFFLFIRAQGETMKHGADGGRNGVGKTVLPAGSEINTFLALTTQRSTKATLLMGVADLARRKVGGQSYNPRMYYSHVNRNVPYPILSDGAAGTTEINRFRQSFEIARPDDTPGLSVVVPFSREYMNFNLLEAAYVRKFYVPIMRGRMVIRLRDLTTERDITLDATTLPQVITERYPEFYPYIALLEHSNVEGIDMLVELADVFKVPDWERNVKVTHTTDTHPQELFAQGKPIHVRIEFPVTNARRRETKPSYVDFVLTANFNGSVKPEVWRNSLNVPNRDDMPSLRAFSLLLAEDLPIVSLLGDAEDPAHTEWREVNELQKYAHGKTLLRFIKKIPLNVFTLLQPPPGEEDKSLFSDVLSIPMIREIPEPEDEDIPTPLGPRIGPFAQREDPCLILPLAGGKMKIAYNKEAEIRPGSKIKLTFKYVGAGHSKADFNFVTDDEDSGVEIETESHCVAEAVKANVLIVKIKKDFELVLSGFDTRRMLKTTAKVMRAR